MNARAGLGGGIGCDLALNPNVRGGSTGSQAGCSPAVEEVQSTGAESSPRRGSAGRHRGARGATRLARTRAPGFARLAFQRSGDLIELPSLSLSSARPRRGRGRGGASRVRSNSDSGSVVSSAVLVTSGVVSSVTRVHTWSRRLLGRGGGRITTHACCSASSAARAAVGTRVSSPELVPQRSQVRSRYMFRSRRLPAEGELERV